MFNIFIGGRGEGRHWAGDETRKKVKELFSNVSALPLWAGKFVGTCRHRARRWDLHIVQNLLVTHCPSSFDVPKALGETLFKLQTDAWLEKTKNKISSSNYTQCLQGFSYSTEF